MLWNFLLLWTTFWTVIYSWKQTFFSNKNDPKRSIRVSSLHRIPFMVKAYFCRPISFARKPNDWVKYKNRTQIFCQRLTRSSCTCVKLTCRRQRFNRLEYVLAIFYIINTILTWHTMLKCYFSAFSFMIWTFAISWTRLAVFYHIIMRVLCFLKGCLFE